MKIWAISDLHLSFGTPEKDMSTLFPSWKGYQDRLVTAWDSQIKPEDLVLISGDISWAMRLDDVGPDLNFIAQRPGIKVMIRGNHDYWWDTASKVRTILPDSVHIIHNDVFCSGPIAIAGSRLWDDVEYSFHSIIDFQKNLKAKVEKAVMADENEKIFVRELGRLEMSLKLLPSSASVKIAMTHFPPIGLELQTSRASQLFEKYGVQYAVFGHLHSIQPAVTHLFGTARGVEYILASADWLHFQPKLVCEVP